MIFLFSNSGSFIYCELWFKKKKKTTKLLKSGNKTLVLNVHWYYKTNVFVVHDPHFQQKPAVADYPPPPPPYPTQAGTTPVSTNPDTNAPPGGAVPQGFLCINVPIYISPPGGSGTGKPSAQPPPGTNYM